MDLSFSSAKELLQNAQEKGLYDKLIGQMLKDFRLANVHCDLQLFMSPEELKQDLQEKIYYLIMEKFPDYLNLMYVIDIPENVFKTIKMTDVVDVAEQVSFLVLKRELQKVYLKSKYS